VPLSNATATTFLQYKVGLASSSPTSVIALRPMLGLMKPAQPTM
jgi:hypothetical protein